MFSLPQGGSLAVRTSFLIKPYLGGFSYSCLMVPSNCLCLIFACHFLCLFRANSKSWIGWQTKETGWHCSVRVMPSHLLHQCFQAGAKWAEARQKIMQITMLKLLKLSFGSPVIYIELTSSDSAAKGRVFYLQAACMSKWVKISQISCCSLNPGENPRWQHLSSPESSGVKWIKVTPQEERPDKHTQVRRSGKERSKIKEIIQVHIPPYVVKTFSLIYLVKIYEETVLKTCDY